MPLAELHWRLRPNISFKLNTGAASWKITTIELISVCIILCRDHCTSLDEGNLASLSLAF